VLLNAAAGIVAYELSHDAAQAQVPIVQRLRATLVAGPRRPSTTAALSELDAWVAASQELAAD
jgi:anthranilate phosphoribosyltransferase